MNTYRLKLTALFATIAVTVFLWGGWFYLNSVSADGDKGGQPMQTSSSSSVTSSAHVMPTKISFVDPLANCPNYVFIRGMRQLTISGQKVKRIFHAGVDLAKPSGCRINAAADGEVTFSGYTPEAGYNVQIKHANGFVTIYKHGASEPAVKEGDQVKAGSQIMQMGCTGRCAGTHLHLGLKLNGRYVDPIKYIPLNR